MSERVKEKERQSEGEAEIDIHTYIFLDRQMTSVKVRSVESLCNFFHLNIIKKYTFMD